MTKEELKSELLILFADMQENELTHETLMNEAFSLFRDFINDDEITEILGDLITGSK